MRGAGLNTPDFLSRQLKTTRPPAAALPGLTKCEDDTQTGPSRS